jgi:glycogen phosphorylase
MISKKGKNMSISQPTLTQKAQALANNLWWSWQTHGYALWEQLGGDQWQNSGLNPKRLLEQLGDTLESALNPVADQINTFYQSQIQYLNTKNTWYAQHTSLCEGGIAYFSAEYGLHESVAIYSGGLGVLAGDHVKSASDLALPFTAVGLLYRNGYVQQQVDADGQQHTVFLTYDFTLYPLQAAQKDGQNILVEVPIFNETCTCKVWEMNVGRVRLLLLDTDLESNPQHLREITARLYGGDGVTRIQQELVLGVGGVRALRALKVDTKIFHLNEGHSSFLNLERIREYVAQGYSVIEAQSKVKKHSIFTTHTPVEAGHDRFDVDLVWRALEWFAQATNMSRSEVIAWGHWPDESNDHALFNMTFLAMHTCEYLNGVAALHGVVSREMFSRFWGNPPIDQVPITHVTNGVHAPTWQADSVRALIQETLGSDGAEIEPGDAWQGIQAMPAENLWSTRTQLRQDLINLARRREGNRRVRLDLPVWEDRLDPNALTIGFARRFATYKRANLIFSEFERLLAILEKAPGPVQLFFAGKAHPADEGGQALVKAVYQASQHPALQGRVLLIEDYDMEVGRIMVQGADVWLNNPRRPKEASGTSGMKVAMNGGLNLSILDGWWPEGFNGHNGWAIGKEKEYNDQAQQDREDAMSLYKTLEDKVIPTFFDRNENQVPITWLSMSKQAIASCTPAFHSHRQVRDYVQQLYCKAAQNA